MRRMLLCLLVLPGLVTAQSVPSRTRLGAPLRPPVLPTDPTISRLDPVAPPTADMPAPTVLLSDAGPTSVTLSWNAIVGASGYVVYRNDLGALTTPPLPLTTTSYTHRAANDARVTYAYRVVAQYPNGHTGPSAPANFTPPSAPPPSEFDVNLRGNDIVFTWSWPSPMAPHHFMLFGPGMGEGVVVPGNTMTYTLDASTVVDHGLRGKLDYAMSAVFEPGPVTAPGTEWPRASLPYRVGRYRLTLHGFTAQETTNDDSPWHRDGKGDEIFLAAAIHRYEKSTQSLIEATAVRSRVYGDANRVAARVPAGTIPGGGIQAGDQILAAATPAGVPPDSALPLTVWEGDLYPDDVLVVRPAVFESDRDDRGSATCADAWRREVTTRLYPAGGHADRMWQLTHELSVARILQDLSNLESGGTHTDIGMGGQCESDQTIGADRIIAFDSGKIERFLEYGLGTQLRYKGGTGGFYSSGGDYIVHVRIERLPDPPPQAVRR